MQKLTRYSPGGYGAMVPDEGGDWIRYSEIKPRIDKAVDAAVTNGLMAGSMIADEGAGELARLKANMLAAMATIAKQKLPREMSTDEHENADFEGGYDEIVRIARAAIARAKGTK